MLGFAPVNVGATLHLEEAQSTVTMTVAVGEVTDIEVISAGVFAKNAAASAAVQSVEPGIIGARPDNLTKDCPATNALVEIAAVMVPLAATEIV